MNAAGFTECFMAIRFRRSFKVAPGVRVNISKGGVSTSIGPRGAKVTLGRGQVRTTAGLPGTGLSVTKVHRAKKGLRRAPPAPDAQSQQLVAPSAPRRSALWWWLSVLLGALLVAAASGVFAAEIQPGSYRVGMTKDEAKAVSYSNCRFQREGDERSAVLCDGALAKVKLPGVTTKSVRLVFAPPKHDRVTSVRVELAESAGVVAKNLQAQYGALYQTGQRSYTFVGDNDVTATLTEVKVGRPYVTFEHEKGAAARYRKLGEAEQRKKDAAASKLKSF